LGLGLRTVEVSRSHSDTSHWAGLQWSALCRDLYVITHNTRRTDIHAPGGIRTHHPNKRAAAVRRHWHWDQKKIAFSFKFTSTDRGHRQRSGLGRPAWPYSECVLVAYWLHNGCRWSL